MKESSGGGSPLELAPAVELDTQTAGPGHIGSLSFQGRLVWPWNWTLFFSRLFNRCVEFAETLAILVSTKFLCYFCPFLNRSSSNYNPSSSHSHCSSSFDLWLIVQSQLFNVFLKPLISFTSSLTRKGKVNFRNALSLFMGICFNTSLLSPSNWNRWTIITGP